MYSNYKELLVWQKAFLLSVEIYKATKSFPDEEKFGLVSQMRRCAISISSNIAEGVGRTSSKEFVNFLSIAKGSCNELESQLLISRELKFIGDDVFEQLQALCLEILKMTSKLILNLKSKL